MTTKEQYQAVAQQRFEELGDPVILFAYLAHIQDLYARLLKDLLETVDPAVLSEEAKGRVALLDQLLAVSSVDFASIQHPLEAYKIPGAVDIKNKSNILMNEYITALAREGLL